MLNHITIAGRLCHTPELRTTTNGKSVCTVSLACERDYKGQNGEKETDFIDINAFGRTAEFLCKYFTKGRMAIVDGRLQIRHYEGRDGSKKIAVEVLANNIYFGDSKGDAPAADQHTEQKQNFSNLQERMSGVNVEPDGDFAEIDESGEIPF